MVHQFGAVVEVVVPLELRVIPPAEQMLITDLDRFVDHSFHPILFADPFCDEVVDRCEFYHITGLKHLLASTLLHHDATVGELRLGSHADILRLFRLGSLEDDVAFLEARRGAMTVEKIDTHEHQNDCQQILLHIQLIIIDCLSLNT